MALVLFARSACKLPRSSLVGSVSRISSSCIYTANPSSLFKFQNQVSILPAVTNLSIPLKPEMAVRSFQISAVNNTSHTEGKIGHHSTLWNIERIVAFGLLAIIPAAVLFPSKPTDILFAVSVVMHMHWGFEAIAIDYIRPILFGNIIPKIALIWVYFLSAATLGGLLYFIQNDIGIGCAIRKFWSIGNEHNPEHKLGLKPEHKPAHPK